MKHLILGNGPAGVIAAETLRHADPSCDIVLAGSEDAPPYSRMAIPYLLAKNIEEAGTYLRKEPPSLGDEEFDKLMRAEMAAMQGFPLRMKMVQTDTDEKGKSETTTTIIEVTKLELEFATPDSTFVIPPDYEEVQMSATMSPGGQK